MRKALVPAEAAADDAGADAREGEDVGEVIPDQLLRLVDEVRVVAAEEDREIVVLEDRVGRVAREAVRVLEHVGDMRVGGRAPVDGKLAPGLRGHVAPEVRQSPGEGDREPGRRARVQGIDLPEYVVELVAGVP